LHKYFHGDEIENNSFWVKNYFKAIIFLYGYKSFALILA